jgi:hypothetical protein
MVMVVAMVEIAAAVMEEVVMEAVVTVTFSHYSDR